MVFIIILLYNKSTVYDISRLLYALRGYRKEM